MSGGGSVLARVLDLISNEGIRLILLWEVQHGAAVSCWLCEDTPVCILNFLARGDVADMASALFACARMQILHLLGI